MEVRVNVVSRRFRRASLAGLAAFVTAGGAVLATAGSAWAAALSVTQQAGTVGATTVYPGQSGAAIGDLQVDFQNNFSIGDTITIQLQQSALTPPADPAGCGTTNGAVGFASTPTVTVSGGSVSDTTPTFTVATQSSAGACATAGVKDQLVITLTNSSTGSSSDQFQLAITGQKINVGSAVTGNSNNVEESANGASSTTVANVSVFKVTTSVVPAAPSATGVALQPISVTDVTGGNITTAIAFDLGNGAQFTTAGTLTPPAGVTVSGPSETLPAAHLTYTITGTTPANGTFTLSGAVVTVGATAGYTAVTVSTGAANGSPPPQRATSVGSGNVVVTATTSRISGADRYGTAAQISQSITPGSKLAVLVSGTSFADALSGQFLASALSTPTANKVGILTTDPNTLSSATQSSLISNQITNVYIVGGTAAVSDNVANAVAALHVGGVSTQPTIQVVRIAGADRYATNRAVILYALVSLGWGGPNTAVVATGDNFADALAVGPAVVNKGYPLILTSGSTLSPSAQQTLTDLALNKGLQKVVIVGGTAAVSASVESQITGLGLTVAARLAGADRTATAATVASWETTAAANTFSVTGYPGIAGLGFAKSTVYLARGDNFADALAGGPLAGYNGNVILLTASPTSLGSGASSFLAGNGGTITTIKALGGTAAIADSVLTAAIAALG